MSAMLDGFFVGGALEIAKEVAKFAIKKIANADYQYTLVSTESETESDMAKAFRAYLDGKYKQAYEIWAPLAGEGNPVAQSNLGLLYANGYGVTKNEKEAQKWYEKASSSEDPEVQYNNGIAHYKNKNYKSAISCWEKSAKKKNIKAQTNLAIHYEILSMSKYEKSDSQEKYKKEAAYWWKLAAEQGDKVAQFNFGTCCFFGEGIKQNKNEGIKFWQKSARQNFAPAQYNIGIAYKLGEVFKKNEKQAFEYFKASAEDEFVPAQRLLGVAYYTGMGVEENNAIAYKWIAKASNSGDYEAQSILGEMYFHGHGTKKDLTTAIKWYRKAAKNKNPKALFHMGMIYHRGIGVKKDSKKAFQFWLQATRGNSSAAQNNLGSCYMTGQGVTKNRKKGFECYSKALAAGNASPTLQCNFAICKLFGYGTEKDEKEAMQWFRKSAGQGVPLAQANLAGGYYKGKGLTQSFVHAYVWSSIAMVNGLEDAAGIQKSSAKNLTELALEEAKTRTADLLEENSNLIAENKNYYGIVDKEEKYKPKLSASKDKNAT